MSPISFLSTSTLSFQESRKDMQANCQPDGAIEYEECIQKTNKAGLKNLIIFFLHTVQAKTHMEIINSIINANYKCYPAFCDLASESLSPFIIPLYPPKPKHFLCALQFSLFLHRFFKTALLLPQYVSSEVLNDWMENQIRLTLRTS